MKNLKRIGSLFELVEGKLSLLTVSGKRIQQYIPACALAGPQCWQLGFCAHG
jgi:hypothetical protein